MAIIQKIRTRAGVLLAIIIGLALFAFIVGDFLTSGGAMFRRAKMNIAKINGEGIIYTEYENLVAQVEEKIKMQYGIGNLNESMTENARTQAWDELLHTYIMQREYKKLGLAVHGDELFDMIQGRNPHPIIMQLFANPKTGEINRVALSGFLQRMKDEEDSEQKRYWLFIEDMIYKQRLSAKYNTLISKGLYVTKLQAEKREEEVTRSVDINFIQKSYNTISDSSITVSKSEIKKYYNEHKNEFRQEESRTLQVAVFEVIPSDDDFKQTEKWIHDIYPEYAEITDVEQYVRLNSDEEYDFKNYKKDELPDTLKEFMFGANEGDVFGPYFENNAFKIAKLSKIRLIPDSVRISVITLPANQNNARQMQFLADSLKKISEKGYDFEKLVKENSNDASVDNGGDMGWIKEGTNGMQFSDSCFFSKTGDIKVTYSPTAIHVVKITDRSTPVKKVQIGILSREVKPSEQTDQSYYNKASEFAGLNKTLDQFKESAKEKGIALINVPDLKPMDNNINGLDRSRQLVRWAYQAKVGNISPVYLFGNKYAVAVLEKKYEKGYKPVEELTAYIEGELRKSVKAQRFIQEIMEKGGNSTSIDDLAMKLNARVMSATDIRFSSYSVPPVGNEFKLIGAALNTEVNKISEPVEGLNGVYVFSVSNKQNTNQGSNLQITRMYMERDYISRGYSAFEILKELAKVEDRRLAFY